MAAGDPLPHPAWDVIPAGQQGPGKMMGGFWVVLQAWPVRNHWSLALLGPEGARVTAGYGDWDVVQVPRDRGITEWRGRRNFEMSLDLLYDGWITHPLRPQLPASIRGTPNLPIGVEWSRPGKPTGGGGVWIEGMIDNLETLALKMQGDGSPHSLRLFGGVPHTELRWVIQDLVWGDCIRDKVTGRRMRQQVTVHLLEYYQPADLRRLPRGKQTSARPETK